jgi:malate:Na+ symporter
MATGFFAGRRLGMYPIESAIVNACHSGQGGTGDIAILTAANRMQLCRSRRSPPASAVRLP